MGSALVLQKIAIAARYRGRPRQRGHADCAPSSCCSGSRQSRCSGNWFESDGRLSGSPSSAGSNWPCCCLLWLRDLRRGWPPARLPQWRAVRAVAVALVGREKRMTPADHPIFRNHMSCRTKSPGRAQYRPLSLRHDFRCRELGKGRRTFSPLLGNSPPARNDTSWNEFDLRMVRQMR